MAMTSPAHPCRDRSLNRREMLSSLGATLAVTATANPLAAGPTRKLPLAIGQAVVDTTPPLGIELAGFHKPPGQERRITGIRQETAARALVLRVNDQRVAIVALDILTLSARFANEVQQQVAKRTGIPAANVRVCATHSHSTPTFTFLRQWGALPEDYQEQVCGFAVEAVERAVEDLSEAQLHLGKSKVEGGNFNRTTPNWKTEQAFDDQSTDADRWLDTTLHLLRFVRAGKPDVLWYHFACHPVCYQDGLAGPDWVGLVANQIQAKHGVAPGFLQGHAGDVNPGDGEIWIGKAEPTADAIVRGIENALAACQPVTADELQVVSEPFAIPLDMELLQSQLQTYREHPEQCTSGEWVDARFSEAWYASASTWDLQQTTHPTPISALRLGDLAILFHSSELFSFYGLDIQHRSPFAHTVIVGYADDSVGYLADPTAYQNKEYAAVTVPRILDLPPFTPTAAAELSLHAVELLEKLT